MSNEEHDDAALGGEYRIVSVDACIPNEWNPNEMDAATLDLLGENIDEVGFVEPIQVIQIDKGDGKEWFRIIGGEHRWKATKFGGRQTIPAIVMNGDAFKDEDVQKFVTVRLNALRGKINPEKFVSLWRDLAKRYKSEDMQKLLAYADNDKYKALTKDIVSQIDKTSLPEFIKDEFKKKVKDENMTMEGISLLLNELFRKYGSTIDQNYIFFDFGGKQHMQVATDAHLWKMVKNFAAEVSRRDVSMTEAFKELLRSFDMKRLDRLPKINEPTEGE